MLVVVIRYPAVKEGKDAKSLSVPLDCRETDWTYMILLQELGI